MLTSLADILRAVQNFEKEELDKQNIDHAPTIGSMYEGLTREVLSAMVPRELQLQVVDGFVESPDKSLSRQIDCMLVKGQGNQIPYTSSYKWPVKDVIAVFEIKKVLFGRQLYDSHVTLESVFSAFGQYLAKDGVNDKVRGLRFIEMTGRRPTGSLVDNSLLDYFAYENHAPIRVVFGYDGYKTEDSLREAYIRHFKDYLEPKRPPISPSEFPHLIVCGDNALVRFNGHPYLGEMDESGFWPVIGSSSENPLRHLIEFIWYRFATDFGVKFPFDENTGWKSKAVLLGARLFEPISGELGIQYSIQTDGVKEAEQREKSWRPNVLSLAEWKLLRILQISGPQSATGSHLSAWASRQNVDVATCSANLQKLRFIVMEDDQLAGYRDRLFTTFHEGEIWTVFDYEKARLDEYSRKRGPETKKGRRKSVKVAEKLRRAIEDWHRETGTESNPSNSGLGRKRFLVP